jgi:hypothetical protein
MPHGYVLERGVKAIISRRNYKKSGIYLRSLEAAIVYHIPGRNSKNSSLLKEKLERKACI